MVKSVSFPPRPEGRDFSEALMTLRKPALDLDTLRPRLISSVVLSGIDPGYVFLKNAVNATYVKLSRETELLAQEWDGTRTLHDILQAQIGESGTDRFKNTIDTIELLHNAGFLADGPSVDSPPPQARISGSTRFQNKLSTALGSLFVSTPWLVLLTVSGLLGVFLHVVLSGGNALLAFTTSPTAGEVHRLLSYGLGLVILWAGVSLIITLKNLVSAWILSYYHCEVLEPRLRFSYGLVFFDCRLDDIVSAKRDAVSLLFFTRMLLPLLLAPWCVALGHYFSFLEIVWQAGWAVFLFGLSPLFQSELTQYVYYVTGFGDPQQPLGKFLRRKFLSGLFSGTQSTPVQEYFVWMSAATLVWMYFVYSTFWHILLASSTGLAADFMVCGWVMKILVLVYFAVLTTPLIVVLALFFSIGISNTLAVTGSPLRTLAKLGRKIAYGSTPAQEDMAEFLHAIPLFSQLTGQEISVLISRSRIVHVRSGTVVVAQGEQGDAFYCVLSGRLRVMREDEYCQEHLLNELGPGNSFGEIALVERIPRTATVVALEQCTLIELGRKDFEEFVMRSVGGGEKVTNMIRIGRMFMEKGGIFSTLASHRISTLVAMLKRETHVAGTVVFHQGEPGDRFYIIHKGEVFVDQVDADGTSRRFVLGVGGFFGEIALLRNAPRVATITAVGEVELLYLEKTEFFDFLKHNVLFGVQLSEFMDNRMATIKNK